MKRIVLSVMMLSVAVVCLAVCASTPPLCANTVIADVASPDTVRRAVIFERNCGATTDFSTQLSVLAYGEELPDDGGNTFVATGGGKRGPRGGPAVAVRWQVSRELQVHYDPQARTFRKELAAGGATITYHPDE